METPVLTKKQRNQALSANKPTKNKKKSLKKKNTLGHWKRIPRITATAEDVKQITDKFREIFNNIEPVKVNWSLLKDVPRLLRKTTRQGYQINNRTPEMAYVKFGINAVSRSLEKKQSSLVLLTSDISPPIIIKHILRSCQIYQIPLFFVPGLRQITLDTIGFSSMAVAFQIVPKTNSLFSTIQFIKNLMPFRRPTKTAQIPKSSFGSERPERRVAEPPKPVVKLKKVEKPILNYYLYRSNNTRCFIPPVKQTEQLDFIQFDDNDDEENEFPVVNKKAKKFKNRNVYKELKIKRLKPNVNRKKKKTSKCKKS